MMVIRGRKISWRGKCCIVLIWVLALVWAAPPPLGGQNLPGLPPQQAKTGLTPAPQATGTPAKQEEAELWAKDNYEAVVDLIAREKSCAPRHDAKTGSSGGPANKSLISRTARWSVCVRVIPGHPEEPESLLWLEKGYDGTAHARITRPQGASIFKKLVKLKTEHPDASPTELAQLVAVETREDDANTLPSLARLADEFEKIRLSPVLSDELTMDPTTYFIRAESLYGERMALVLHGPEPSAPRQPRPLLEWVERLRRAFSQ